MTRAEILNLFGGFCPVSGSPGSPSPGRIWQRVPVQKAGNSSEVVTGDIYVCCWPCVCDTMEHVRTDQVNINTRNGVETFDALVIGKLKLYILKTSETRFWSGVEAIAEIPATRKKIFKISNLSNKASPIDHCLNRLFDWTQPKKAFQNSEKIYLNKRPWTAPPVPI